jgi:signal recognition particle subunit SRP54
MGPLQQLVEMIPGVRGNDAAGVDERQLARTAAIIDSMTPHERRHPAIINGSRRKRVARGSGTSVPEVNRLLRQYAEMRKMLRTIGTAGRRRSARRALARLR